jgi:opacity protein-like surface antigen/outer membrane receptor protein involved in Fe transport
MSMRQKRLVLLGSSALMLLCLAGAATSQTPDAAPTTTPPSGPPPAAPETPASQTPAPAAPAPQPPPSAAQPQITPAAPGTTTVPTITVTAPPKSPPRTPPRTPPEQPATPAPPAPAVTAPTAPQRRVSTPAAAPSSASTPAAGTPSQTQIFDQARDNIFAPVGTAPTTWSRADIEALPQGSNTPFEKVLLQFPGVSQDSSNEGNFHVRNEHLESSLAFRINGILLPDSLGAFGQFLDPSFVGSLSLITGALPAQYGLRTVGVVDIKTGAFDNSGQIGVYGGSRETGNYSIQYGGKTGKTEYFFAGRFLQNILGISNPTPLLNAVHDRTSQDRSFAYVSTIIDPTTRLSFIGGTATNSYQIPNVPGLSPSFTAFGITSFPSALVNETQVEKYKFGVLALQKSVNDVDLQLSYFTRTSSVQFTPDLIGDLMFNGVATNVYRGSVVNGIQADSAFRLNEAHTLRAGVFASMEKTTVSGVNELLPIDGVTGMQTPALGDVPFQAIDTSVLLGWLGGVYLADEWKLTDRLTLNTGARFDQMWQYVDANQLSPRISLTYSPFDTTTFHAGFARNFTPPAQVIAAPANTALFTGCPAPLPPTCTTVQAPSVPPPYYPMQPERSNVYDIGVVQKVLPGLELGADVYLKMTRDQINQGQFGAALVLNGFQYERGLNNGVELKAVYTDGDLRAYANLAWASQRGNNVVTNQYLLGADEFAYTRNNWVYADHSQVWTGSGGVSYLWYGTRFSADLIYGSGLRSGFANTDHLPPYAQVNAGISHEYDIPGWNPVTLRFDVVNVFDTSYVIKNGTGIGVFANAYGPRIGYYFGLAQKFGPGAAAKKPAAALPRRVLPYLGPWTWTGFYIGGNVGYSASRFTTDTSFDDAPQASLVATIASTKHYGALGGGQTGYNWQLGMWLAGIETDIDFAHQRITTGSACPGTICNPAITVFDAPASVIHQHNLDWFGTVRGRLGAAVTPDIVPYITGGLGYGEIEHAGVMYGSDGLAPNDIGNTFTNRALRAGWTAGGGIEARLAGNVTGKIEYLHLDFGFDKAQALLFQATPIAANFNSRITEDIVRLGINYKFDPYARYAPATKAAAAASEPLYRPHMIYKPPAAALWTWTGFYFGVNAGYAAGKFNTDTLLSDASLGTPLLATSSSASRKGGIGGAQTGYNWQAGMWLAGVETDIQFSTRRVDAITQCPGAICNPGVAAFDAPVTLAANRNLSWFATARGRLGAVVLPNSVAYVTGGLAVGAIAQSGTISGVAFDPSGNPFPSPMNFIGRTTKTALTIGGGIETRLAGNVTGKVEYLHMDFGSASTLGTNNQNTTPIAVTLNSRITNDIVRLGINYKFDPNSEAPVYQTARSAPVDIQRIIVKDPVKTLWTWTGYYLGINAGYGWGKSDTDAFFNDNTIPASFATGSTFELKGETFGLQTGYNFQIGNWVWGIEADTQLSGQRNNPKFICPGTICNPAGAVIASFDQDQIVEWFGTLRARLGADVGPDTLVYATGGAAVAGLVTAGNIFGYDPNGNPVSTSFKNITINGGWTVGGGVEAHLCGNWTGKVEYLYMNLGSMTTNFNNQQVMVLTAGFNSRITDKLVRAAINYKFD